MLNYFWHTEDDILMEQHVRDRKREEGLEDGAHRFMSVPEIEPLTSEAQETTRISPQLFNFKIIYLTFLTDTLL